MVILAVSGEPGPGQGLLATRALSTNYAKTLGWGLVENWQEDLPLYNLHFRETIVQ